MIDAETAAVLKPKADETLILTEITVAGFKATAPADFPEITIKPGEQLEISTVSA